MMVPVEETALWTAVAALDGEMDSLAETMDGDKDQESMYRGYSAARDAIMQQIKTAQSAAKSIG